MKKFIFAMLIILFVASSFLFSANFSSRKPKIKKDVELTTIKKEESKPEVADKKIEKSKSFLVYFPNGSKLKGESRSGDFDAKKSIEELLSGPKERGNVSYIPKNTKLLALNIKNNIFSVNFSKEILNAENAGADAENLTLYSITNTLTQIDKAKEVVIQIEGKSKGEIDQYFIEDFWGHVGLYGQPFKNNAKIIKDEQ